MIFVSPYSRDERAVVARLQLLGLDGERAIRTRGQFRAELRDRLVSEASRANRCGDQREAMAGC